MQARLVDLDSRFGDNPRNSYIDKEPPSIRPESNQLPSNSMVILQFFLSHFDLCSIWTYYRLMSIDLGANRLTYSSFLEILFSRKVRFYIIDPLIIGYCLVPFLPYWLSFCRVFMGFLSIALPLILMGKIWNQLMTCQDLCKPTILTKAWGRVLRCISHMIMRVFKGHHPILTGPFFFKICSSYNCLSSYIFRICHVLQSYTATAIFLEVLYLFMAIWF